MKINVRRISPDYFDVSVTIGNAHIELGLMGKDEREEFAQMLRGVADELVPDDVPYEELESAWMREQALKESDEALPPLPEGRQPKLYDVGPWFDEDEMREYARAAIEAAKEA
ncbi:hypothetical protein QZM15_32975 [Burkholderia sp. AU44665]|uniref:hypothetical protein n=1 Tax=Burkholderia sp. AU44665 TaxID=3059203 RepID=UPI00265DFC54|nr:hypothetical protein [Burkholderia sp. AU44665]MDN7703300.1 hypothetical protein [Burkholderia sp. AU44665]